MSNLRPFTLTILVYVIAAMLAPNEVRAQEDGFGFEANVGYMWLNGDLGQLIKGGVAGELDLFMHASNFRFGIGGNYASMSPEDASANNVGKVNVYGLVQYMIETESRTRPYVQGRVGYARLDSDQFFGGAYKQEGIEFGFVGGIEYPLNENIALDFTAIFSFLSMGDAKVNDVPVFGAPTSASTVGLLAGVTITP